MKKIKLYRGYWVTKNFNFFGCISLGVGHTKLNVVDAERAIDDIINKRNK